MAARGEDHGHYKHGLYGTRVLHSYNFMHRRCYDPRHSEYKNYGGRGLTVARRWHSVLNFFKDMGHPPDGYTLDRINNAKGYSKSNCRWASPKEQARNRRSNIIISDGRETACVKHFAEKYGINYYTLLRRVTRGYPKEAWFFKGHLKTRHLGR